MNIILNPDKLGSVETRSRVENVSRRTILKGLGIAGGLVLAAPLTARKAFAAYQTGAASFESILATETDYLRLRLQYHELAQRHAQAIVSYEALVRGARPGPMPNLTPVASAATPAAASNPMGSM